MSMHIEDERKEAIEYWEQQLLADHQLIAGGFLLMLEACQELLPEAQNARALAQKLEEGFSASELDAREQAIRSEGLVLGCPVSIRRIMNGLRSIRHTLSHMQALGHRPRPEWDVPLRGRIGDPRGIVRVSIEANPKAKWIPEAPLFAESYDTI